MVRWNAFSPSSLHTPAVSQTEAKQRDRGDLHRHTSSVTGGDEKLHSLVEVNPVDSSRDIREGRGAEPVVVLVAVQKVR
jgi:hypothetical protein